jgi:hypothetical protein
MIGVKVMSARTRFLLDAVLLTTFVAAYRPTTTGMALHEWLGLAIVAPTLVHLTVNWDWLVRVATSTSRRLRATTRANLVVDIALFISTVTVTLSGFFVSTTLAGLVGLSPSPPFIWHTVHSMSADAFIALALLHTGLHWKWFGRRLGLLPKRSVRTTRSRLVPAPVPVAIRQRGETR